MSNPMFDPADARPELVYANYLKTCAMAALSLRRASDCSAWSRNGTKS